ncbi:serine/threonine protein kinase [Mycobacterium sp. SM1]|uniref:serine/threonine-protein kinase n=1 Tax=Mycobacterium sp. SM1 TaxID=2816243 RepID=UPI001BCCDEDE|nr:serine/threonine-protein kinase [Mycobacterium sp. SM1]MBS4730572.1 serine/threonine protein kinase [Mycobacterium sp. SM1]
MPLTIGAAFANFTIIRSLGSGAMGEVYLAQHPRLPRRDALKVLLAHVSADSEYRSRFEREADLASTLWHPHIVGVHDRGEAEGRLWISMDFVDGLDAARLLAERFPAGMPPNHVLDIVTAVASALDYAHKQGLLHRDIKPANIMLTNVDDDGGRRILLGDFGIARSVDDISGLTATNMTLGTLAYCAPEQLKGEDLDGRADQYALAATAYHLLTGSQLFPHSNTAVVIGRHLTALPPALADRRPELAALDPVLAVALAKDPDDRFPRCSDFAQALAEHAMNLGLASTAAATAWAPALGNATTAVSPPRPPTEEPPERAGLGRLSKWWLIAISAATVVVSVVVGVVALAWEPWQRKQPTVTASSTPPKSPPPMSTSSPTVASSRTPPPVPAAAPPQPHPPTGPIIIARCWYPGSDLGERPSAVEFGCDGTGELQNMHWTSWGPAGADGTGTAVETNCVPSCAEGQRIAYPVVVHAEGIMTAPASCRADFSYYSTLVIAYPQRSSAWQTNITYKGMPADQYEDEPRCH